MNSTIRCHFLEAEVSISTAAFHRIVHDAIKAVVARPEGFWIENLDFFSAQVMPSSGAVNVRYSIADFPDGKVHFSKAISDDQFKAALMETMLSELLGVVNELCELEYWRRIVHVRNLDRNPRRLPEHSSYLKWIAQLQNEQLSRSHHETS